MNFWKPSAVLAALSAVACSHTQMARSLPVLPAPGAMQRQIRNAVDAGDGDYEIKTLRARLDADPANLAIRIELARHYQKAGFPEVAIEHLRLAVERAPESSMAALELAKLLRIQDRPGEGAAILSAYNSRQNPTVDTLAWLGLLLDESGDWKAGENAHRAALALAPGRDDLHNNLGWSLLNQGRKAEAGDEFRAALKIDPRSVVARNNLGTSMADQPKEAVAHLQSVVDPASAHSNVAAVLIEEGNYAEARKEIETALSYNRQNTAALNNLRLLSDLDGKPAELKPVVRQNRVLARLQWAWRHVTGTSRPPAEPKNSGSPVASR